MVHFHDQGFACHSLSIPARDSVDLEKNPLAMFMQKHGEGVQAFFGTGICVQSLHKRAGLDGVDLLLQDKTLGADLVDLVGGERLRLNLLPVRQLREAQLHPLAYLQRPQISVGLQRCLGALSPLKAQQLLPRGHHTSCKVELHFKGRRSRADVHEDTVPRLVEPHKHKRAAGKHRFARTLDAHELLRLR